MTWRVPGTDCAPSRHLQVGVCSSYKMHGMAQLLNVRARPPLTANETCMHMQVHAAHPAMTMLASRPPPEPEPVNALPARCSEGSMQLSPGTELAQRLLWGRQSGLAQIFSAEAAAATAR